MALVSEEDPLLLAQEEEEDARLIAAETQYEVDGRSCVDDDETTLWLQYTQWPVRLANRPLDILSATVLQPVASHDDYLLGDWAGADVVSPAVHEARLRELMHAADRMFARALATLDQTHHRLRCWLNTYQPRFRPVPFQRLQTAAGLAAYIATWKRFLCYVFRVWATDEAIRREIYGFAFRPEEAGQMAYIWSLLCDLEEYREESGQDNNTGEQDKRGIRVSEAVFQLSMTFWTFRSITGDLASSVLVHFTSVLGIHRHSLAYKSAYSYTSTLSALIWVGRLLFLEYALPLSPYETLVYPWPARVDYVDQIQRLEQIRSKYLLRGGFHPFGELIELRAYGKWVVKKEGVRANLAWAADGQSFAINDQTFRLLDFTYMYKASIEQVARRISQLMLGFQPAMNLAAITDDLTCRTPGWSFLQDERNKLRQAYKALTRRAWDLPSAGLAKAGHWLTDPCMAYLKAGLQLSDELFAAVSVGSDKLSIGIID
jgi:hypothetical protein